MKYLKITLGDSDFYKHFTMLGALLLERMNTINSPYTENKIDFEKLKLSITEYLVACDVLNGTYWDKGEYHDWSDDEDISGLRAYITEYLKISIVEETEGGDWENLFIPLCSSEEERDTKRLGYIIC